MREMTDDDIKNALETAAYVERLLPEVRPPKYRCCMPEIVYTPQEIIFMDRKLVKPRPTQEQITIWETVILQWLPILTVYERNLVWKRADRLPWKLLCRELGKSRVHLWRIYDRAILKIRLTAQQN
jgi:hypothetical protein